MFLPLEAVAEREQLRVCHINLQQTNKAKKVWKTSPDATLEDLKNPSVDDEPQPVALKHEDAYQVQCIKTFLHP